MADRTSAEAARWFARSLKPRYDGTAIASRMPMITMTTRSSISVKPSSRSSRCRNLVIEFSLRLWACTRSLSSDAGRACTTLSGYFRPSDGADAAELFDRRDAGGDLRDAVLPHRPHARLECGALDHLARRPLGGEQFQVLVHPQQLEDADTALVARVAAARAAVLAAEGRS